MMMMLNDRLEHLQPSLLPPCLLPCSYFCVMYVFLFGLIIVITSLLERVLFWYSVIGHREMWRCRSLVVYQVMHNTWIPSPSLVGKSPL